MLGLNLSCILQNTGAGAVLQPRNPIGLASIAVQCHSAHLTAARVAFLVFYITLEAAHLSLSAPGPCLAAAIKPVHTAAPAAITQAPGGVGGGPAQGLAAHRRAGGGPADRQAAQAGGDHQPRQAAAQPAER